MHINGCYPKPTESVLSFKGHSDRILFLFFSRSNVGYNCCSSFQSYGHSCHTELLHFVLGELLLTVLCASGYIQVYRVIPSHSNSLFGCSVLNRCLDRSGP